MTHSSGSIQPSMILPTPFPQTPHPNNQTNRINSQSAKTPPIKKVSLKTSPHLEPSPPVDARIQPQTPTSTGQTPPLPCGDHPRPNRSSPPTASPTQHPPRAAPPRYSRAAACAAPCPLQCAARSASYLAWAVPPSGVMMTIVGGQSARGACRRGYRHLRRWCRRCCYRSGRRGMGRLGRRRRVL
jgi:hypothetical protein